MLILNGGNYDTKAVEYVVTGQRVELGKNGYIILWPDKCFFDEDNQKNYFQNSIL